MADRMQATPQNAALGALARALRSAQSFAERPFGYENPPVALLSEMLGLPAVQRTVERMSYGEPLTTGAGGLGGTTRLRPDTAEAALAVLPVVPGVVRGGLGAVKRATDLNAIRDYVRATQGLSGLPGTAVVKPKGGNWISGAGSPEEAVRGLKATAVGMDPAERIPLLDNLIREQEAAGAVTPEFLNRMRAERGRLTGDAELNRWIDQKLARYIRNEMGTPEDPVRKLAERDVLHVDPEQVGVNRWKAPNVRQAQGYPKEGLGQSEAAKAWEAASDVSIFSDRAGDISKGYPLEIVEANPWLSKLDPSAKVHELDAPSARGLGFDHLIDELRNATRADSDLPRELRLRPEQLSKVSMPQAVELVDRINKWRAAQKAQADLARAQNAAVFTHKEYPGQSYKWVELRAPERPENWQVPPEFEVSPSPARPEQFVVKYNGKIVSTGYPTAEAAAQDTHRIATEGALEDALKYEGETMGHCVGGYCPDVMEGSSRIFSLRDAKGQPHVTVEVQPMANFELEAAKLKRAGASPEEIAAFFENPPQDIIQIKGKANRAPKEEYLPYVQDFVKSQRWGRVGDLQNTGLVEYTPARQHTPAYLTGRVPRFEEAGIQPGYYTEDELEKLIRDWQKRTGNEPGFNKGGGVVNSAGVNYNAQLVNDLAAQLESELYA